MSTSNAHEFTALLTEFRHGNQEAGRQLVPLVYQELRRLAQYYLQQERPGHTLQATALVHEAYLRLFDEGVGEWQDRAHFFAVAARQMRRLLVDHARAAKAGKRQGAQILVPLEEVTGKAAGQDEDLIALDEALDRLEVLAPRAGQIVALRFFGGLTEKEAAEALGISLATLKRDWDFAKAWLYSQLSGSDRPEH
jgi:RNA polymerase sigma factor (TIGR02999 family)